VAREPGAVVAASRLPKVTAGGQASASVPQPGTDRLGTPRSGTPRSGAAEPGNAQPGSAQPGGARSGAAESGGARSGGAQPGGAEFGAAQAGTSRAVAASQNPEAEGMALCLRLLTAAPRTRVQLEQALHRHGVPPQAAEAVLVRLAKARLVDDPTFARMWVESRHHARGLARRALSAELRQRGVSEGDVIEAVAELGPEQEEEAARRLVTGRLAATRGRPLPTRMRRLMGLLARKGYSQGLAYRIVREALEQEKADAAAAGLDDGTGLSDGTGLGDTGCAGLDEEAILDAALTLDDDAGLDDVAGLGSDGGDGFGSHGIEEP
jgi:regulatory protein